MEALSEFSILLVADDLVYADHVRELLDCQRIHTFKTERVSLLCEAKKRLREKKFDVILVDFDLKEMSDVERISELNSEKSSSLIMALASATDQQKVSQAIEFGLHDVLLKDQHDEENIVSKLLFAIRRMAITQSKNKDDNQAKQPLYDERTGLPAESLFNDRLEQSLKRAESDVASIGVFAIKFVKYSAISDEHDARLCHSLLHKVGKMLVSMGKKTDTVAHVEDDKFYIIVDNIGSTSELVVYAENLIRVFSRRIQVDAAKLKMTASVGVANYSDCTDSNDLIKSVDWAMKRAADAGGNRYKLYSDNMKYEAVWKYGLVNELAKATQHRQFELHYQPLFGMKENRVIGFEALLRWNHPEEGMLMPGAFIDELEASDLILDVGEWVMNEACKKLKFWHKKYPYLVMSVNLSARQLSDPCLLERVTSALEQNSMNPQMLELEITERQLVDTNNRINQSNIQSLIDLGVGLALDDFGTGYSNESYFHDFPKNTFHTLKIDRTDIMGMMVDPEIERRVEKYVAFSHQNGMRVIAEGIEVEAQLKRVEMLGIEVMQGYLLSKPVSSSEIEDGLRRNSFSFDCNSQETERELANN